MEADWHYSLPRGAADLGVSRGSRSSKTRLEALEARDRTRLPDPWRRQPTMALRHCQKPLLNLPKCCI